MDFKKQTSNQALKIKKNILNFQNSLGENGIGFNRFLLGLCLFILISWQLAVRAEAQQITQTPDLTGNQSSGLVLYELWTKNFDENTSLRSAYVLFGPDRKFQRVELNADQLEKSNNVWRATNFSFDLNGAKTEKNHSADEYVYVSSSGKRISFGGSSWKMEDSEGNLIKQSSEDLFKYDLVFSPDDSLIVGQDEDGNASLYDGEGNSVKKIEGRGWFSPNSQYIGSFITNPKPPHEFKFCLLDHYGNSVFELPLDSSGQECSFNEEGTRIAVVSWNSLYVLDLKGNIISQITKQHVLFESPVFLNPNLLIAGGGSNIWKIDLSSGTAKVESIQKIEYPGNIEKIGENLAIIYGLGNEGPDPGTDNGLEIINPTGKLLASAKLLRTSAGMQIKGDFIVVWSASDLDLFKVSKE